MQLTNLLPAVTDKSFGLFIRNTIRLVADGVGGDNGHLKFNSIVFVFQCPSRIHFSLPPWHPNINKRDKLVVEIRVSRRGRWSIMSKDQAFRYYVGGTLKMYCHQFRETWRRSFPLTSLFIIVPFAHNFNSCAPDEPCVLLTQNVHSLAATVWVMIKCWGGNGDSANMCNNLYRFTSS